ncbi:MAG: aspartate aminotransferase family protein, partial [Bacteroidota bacterium]
MNHQFLNAHLAQTTPFPMVIEVDSAEGSSIYDKKGKAYLDFISGLAVSNFGHGHPRIKDAIQQQLDKHLHVMVYGEFQQDIIETCAKKLVSILPGSLDTVYFVNSGTEAIETALKLAKRTQGKQEIIAFNGAYHGATHGSLSVSGNEMKKRAFRPLLPGVQFIQLNHFEDLTKVTKRTAAVLLETIQGDAGIRIPNESFMKELRGRCDETNTLLILDEIQSGMGRTGKPFAFEHYDVVPDILVLGKALGGGLPIGALVANKKLMSQLTHDPMLGHITTFGGNPLICAAANAALTILEEEIDFQEVEKK